MAPTWAHLAHRRCQRCAAWPQVARWWFRAAPRRRQVSATLRNVVRTPVPGEARLRAMVRRVVTRERQGGPACRQLDHRCAKGCPQVDPRWLPVTHARAQCSPRSLHLSPATRPEDPRCANRSRAWRRELPPWFREDSPCAAENPRCARMCLGRLNAEPAVRPGCRAPEKPSSRCSRNPGAGTCTFSRATNGETTCP